MLESLFGLNAKLGALRATLSDTWAAKLDALRTGLTDARMALLDKLTALDQLTATRGGYLDLLPTINSKTTAKIVKFRSAGAMLTDVVLGVGVTVVGGTYSTAFTTVLSITGAGALRFFAMQLSSGYTGYIRITIDGVVVIDKSGTASGASKTLTVLGGLTWDGANRLPTLDFLEFQTSLLVEIKASSGVSGTWLQAYETY